MTSRIIGMLLMCSLVGCVPDQSPVQIVAFSALPLEAECTLETGDDFVARTAGSLDLAGSTAYFIDLRLRSGLQENSLEVGDRELEATGRNDFRASEIVLTYETEPAAGFETETIPVFFSIPPSGDSLSVLRTDLIGPKAAEKLLSFVPVTAAGTPRQTVQLLVTVQLRGTLASGQAVETNEATYPITVYRTDFTGCAAGETLALNGPCGTTGGQDSPIVCVPPATP